MPGMGFGFGFGFHRRASGSGGGDEPIPANALLNEDGTPLRAEDGTILLKEPE